MATSYLYHVRGYNFSLFGVDNNRSTYLQQENILLYFDFF